MTHALVTITSKIDAKAVAPLSAEISKLGNPARDDVRAKLDARDGDSGTHFLSLHAILSGHGNNGYLILEFSADGSDEKVALARIVGAIGAELEGIFKHSVDWRTGEILLAYLSNHRVHVGHGFFDNPGVAFTGTPGMSVGRIWNECRLAARIIQILAAQRQADVRAIDRLNQVRAVLRTEPDFAGARETPIAPPSAPPPLSTVGLVLQLIVPFLTTYLWPVGIVALLLSLGAGIMASSFFTGIWVLVMATVGLILFTALGVYSF